MSVLFGVVKAPAPPQEFLTSFLLAHCGGGQDKPGSLGPSAERPGCFFSFLPSLFSPRFSRPKLFFPLHFTPLHIVRRRALLCLL